MCARITHCTTTKHDAVHMHIPLYMCMYMCVQFVLSKYGYLRCQIKRRRREARRHGRGGRHHYDAGTSTVHNTQADFQSWGENFLLSEEGGLEVCDESEVQKAIREYQRTYNLPPTGELDDETKLLMSTTRCGNKDNAKDGEAAATTTTTTSTSTGTPTTASTSTSSSDALAAPPHFPSSSSKNSVSDNTHISSSSSGGSHGHHHHHHHHKADDSNKSNVVAASQRLWKRAINRIRADDPSQLIRLLKGAASSGSQRESRHRRHLEDYISRLSRQDSRLTEPWSEEEHQRARRSIQVTATREEAEGPMNFAGLQISEHHTGVEAEVQMEGRHSEMFNKEIIRWRLLTTGYSTRIPVEDQLATLDLAFRMWSEVIPLRFVEDTESDINEVDIEVAFGRGKSAHTYRFGTGGGSDYRDDDGSDGDDDDNLE